MAPEAQQVAAQKIADILLPYRDESKAYYEEDKVGRDEDIRTIVRETLKLLDVQGLSGCRLCLS